ncbi:MAG TPA: diaminopimelate decarboxylase [Anaerolineaceae bacterium]
MTSLNNLFPLSAGRDSAGCLTIAGHALRPLAEQYGTPLYLYDAQTITEQVRSLRDALSASYPAPYEITYAAKAYFSLGIARHLAAMGLGVDVVSLGELSIARRAGFAGGRVHLHGNNKSVDELAAALKWGVQAVVVDSLEELETLESLAQRAQMRARIWLRISPGVTVDSHAYLQTAHPTSKFGLPTEGGLAAEAIRRARASQWLQLTGLHTHLGSQFFEAEPYREAITRLVALADETGFIPEEISPGGGWGVPYVPDQPDASPLPWVQAVAGTVQTEYARRGWPLPRLVVEPGRWLVARAGLALYSVGTTKTSGDGTRFVAVDGGMADNPRPALYQARYTACLADRPDAEALQKVNLVGKYCESGDQLITDLWLPEVHRGDLLVVPVAGAYQLSMASNYNLTPRPAVLWVEPDRVEVLQPRETIEEMDWWVAAG